MKWTPEQDESLREYVARGISCSRIAGEISSKHKIMVSRNAVIGRIHRLGINPKKVAVARRPAVGRDRSQKVSAPRPKPAPKPQRFRCEPITGLRQADVVPLNISIHELTAKTCHWPYGDGAPFVYCGQAVFDGSYCESHQALSQRVAGGWERPDMITRGRKNLAASVLTIARSEDREEATW